jgi:hypothetical protein
MFADRISRSSRWIKRAASRMMQRRGSTLIFR